MEFTTGANVDVLYGYTWTLPWGIISEAIGTTTVWVSMTTGSFTGSFSTEFTNLLATPQTATVQSPFTIPIQTTSGSTLVAHEASLGGPLQNSIVFGTFQSQWLTQPFPEPTAVTSSNSAQTDTLSSGTTTATSPPVGTKTSTPKPSHAGISKGKAVGIGIGSAAAGALIAVIIAFLLLRRSARQKAYDATPMSASSGSAIGSDKAGAGHSIIPLSSVSFSGTDTTLTQPEEDRVIAANVSKLDTVIKNHAQSFFAGSSAAGVPSMMAFSSLEKILQSEARVAPDELFAMLSNPDTRVGAVRFLISWAILSNVDYKSPADHTLLPPALAECVSAMKLDTATSPGQLALVSKWRQITGALVQPSYSSKTMSSEDPRHFNITQLAKDLDDVLHTFTSPDGKGRVQNMTEIIKQGAYVGYVLFVQPTTWTFDWGESTSIANNELVIFPALVQISDDQGRAQPRPLRSTSKQVVARGR